MLSDESIPGADRVSLLYVSVQSVCDSVSLTPLLLNTTST